MGATDSADLVRRARKGDTCAFELLLAPLIEPGRRLALGMLHSPDAAEDAVQEACLRAWRRLSTYDANRAIQPWFLGIVANQCRSARRSRWWSVVTGFQGELAAVGPEDTAVEGADLRRAVRGLGAAELTAVVLFYYLDLPLAVVAETCGTSPDAVKKRLFRATRRLRPMLSLAEPRPAAPVGPGASGNEIGQETESEEVVA